MANHGKKAFKRTWKYTLLKLLKENTEVIFKLQNGIQYIMRAKTKDRSVVKDVWLKDVYNKYGITVEPGDLVVDVGAHIGCFSVYAGVMNQGAPVFAFEPFSENYQILSRNVALNKLSNVKAINKGLFDETGVQTLYLEDNNTGGHSLVLGIEATKAVQIQTITFADMLREEKISHIQMLKIDCEGCEFAIMKNAAEILPKVDKIIMECHPYQENTVEGMMKILQDHGMEVHREDCGKNGELAMLYAKKHKSS